MPVFADVARSWSEGHLPLLSPYSWVCSNLAGEFQYGTFSIFVNAAVVSIWKFALTFPQQAAALSMTHLFVLAMGGYLLARGRKLSEPLSCNGRVRCDTQRLDHVLGRDQLVRRARRIAWLPWAWWGLERALDPRRGPLSFSLACAIRLPACDRRISLHRRNARGCHRLAHAQVVRHDKKNIGSVSDVLWRSAGTWPFGSGVAGLDRLHPRLGPTTRSRALAFSMARASGRIARLHFAELDSKLDQFFITRQSAHFGRTGVRFSRTRCINRRAGAATFTTR